MKPLKSMLPFLLSLMLALLLSVPALAVEGEVLEEQEPVTVAVGTLDELLAAIESAKNGDTIILQNEILISKNCIIGQEEKHITIIPASDFDGDTMLDFWPWEEQYIVLQNIILDGQNKSTLSAIEVNFYGAPNSKGTIYLSSIQVNNFISGHSNIYINDISAVIDDCQFLDNTAQRSAGIEIAPNATAKISDCVFSGNVSRGNGGALLCRGQVQIERTVITQNQAVNSNSAVMGGGIYIDQQAYCEIIECQINNNTAHLGGGIANYGNALVIDTVLCKNQGLNGASDLQTFSSEQFTVTYSDEMQSIYSEDNPVGFYLDDMDNRFNPGSNAVFLGESLAGDISISQYGAKFVFANDLLQEPSEEIENSDEQEPSVEPPTETEPQEPTTPDTSAPIDPEPNTSNDSDQLEPEPNTSDSSDQFDPEPDTSDGSDQADPKPDTSDSSDQPDPEPDTSDGSNQFDPEPDTSDSSDQLESEPDTSNGGDQPEPEPDTSDTSKLPVVPDESGEDTTIQTTPPTTSKPSRPTVQEPPVVQPEETSKLKLSCGGVTLDTAIPLVLLGYGDGQLHENVPITRAQIVVLLHRSLTDNSKSHIADTNTFADVESGAWYYNAVAVLSSAGVVNGYDGLFRPHDTLTIGELITIFTRFVEPQETPMPDNLPYTKHWAYGNIVTSVAYGWIDNATEIEPDRTITRGEAVEIINSIFGKL